MTIANIGTRQANSTFACGGAQVRAHCRHLATVVTVRGEIDADNAERLGERIRRFILRDNPMVLDMSDVSGFAAAAVSLLKMLDDSCRAAAVEWTLVAGPAVLYLLGDRDDAATMPVAGSVHEALNSLADAIVSRRQSVLPLVRKTA
ncbi:MAG: STAS domain-containing protein [Mycobacterium sp.]|nr:STAS domain-containing protein [Mycobacterium sp.]